MAAEYIEETIGYVKGPKGDTGGTGPTGPQGPPGVTDYATTSAAGLVRIGDDHNINSSNGTLSLKTAFTQASTLAALTSGEAWATMLGKLAKAVSDVVTIAGDYLKASKVYNGLDKAATGFALDASQGKVLNDKIVYGRFYRNDATIADFQTWCATLDNAIPYPVYFGQSLCAVLTGISGTFLVGTLVLTNNKGTARMLVGNGVAGIKSQVFAITVNLSTGAITTSRLLSDDAMDGVGSAGINATDGISTATNLTPSTNKTLGSVTVDRGTYNFEAYVRFTSAPANTRLIWFIGGSSAPANTSNGIHFEDLGSQAVSSARGMTFNRTLRVNADNTTVYFIVATTTACTVDVSRLSAYKIAVYQQ